MTPNPFIKHLSFFKISPCIPILHSKQFRSNSIMFGLLNLLGFFKDTPDGYIPECITWGHTVTSRYKEATADFPNACSTVEVSKAIAKCSCNNTGGFFAVRTVAQPIPSTPKPGNASARTDTTELTTSDSVSWI